MNKLLFGGVMYIGMNFLIGYMTQKDQTGVTSTNPETGETITVAGNTGDIPPYQLRPKQLNEGAEYRAFPKMLAPIWPQDSRIDVIVTVSPSFNPTPISHLAAEYIVLNEKNFHMNNSTDKRTIDTKFKVPKSVQNNGTLWGHFYVGLAGSVLDPLQQGFDPGTAYHVTYPLTQYLNKKKTVKTRNLLDDLPAPVVNEPVEENPSGPIIVNHYHPNATFALVPGLGVKEFATMHPAMKQFLRLEATGARDGTGQNGWYCK